MPSGVTPFASASKSEPDSSEVLDEAGMLEVDCEERMRLDDRVG